MGDERVRSGLDLQGGMYLVLEVDTGRTIEAARGRRADLDTYVWAPDSRWLAYDKTARNFSPLMCMAATTTIVQAKRVVTNGGIDPEHVITPGIFVDRIVEVSRPVHEDTLIAAGRSYP